MSERGCEGGCGHACGCKVILDESIIIAVCFCQQELCAFSLGKTIHTVFPWFPSSLFCSQKIEVPFGYLWRYFHRGFKNARINPFLLNLRRASLWPTLKYVTRVHTKFPKTSFFPTILFGKDCHLASRNKDLWRRITFCFFSAIILLQLVYWFARLKNGCGKTLRNYSWLAGLLRYMFG